MVSSDEQEALAALVCEGTPGLSTSAVSRLTIWLEEFQASSILNMPSKHHFFIWADGLDCTVRSDKDLQRILVIIGATPSGGKEFVAIEEGTAIQDRAG